MLKVQAIAAYQAVVAMGHFFHLGPVSFVT